jgi:hypothetical protein
MKFPVRRKYYFLLFITLIGILLGIVIGIEAANCYPLKRGTLAEFWKYMAGIDIENNYAYNIPENTSFNFGSETIEYAIPEFLVTKQRIHFVSLADVLDSFPPVDRKLEQLQKDGNQDATILAYREWKESDHVDNVSYFLQVIQAKRIKIDADHYLVYKLVENEFFQSKVYSARNWFWANIFFEWGFLLLCVVFLTYPFFANASLLRTSIHITLSPLLIVLPVYFGYCTLSFTSWGRTGGIVYQDVIYWIPTTQIGAFDHSCFQYVPQILSMISLDLSQGYPITENYVPGPTFLILVGMGAAGVYTIVSLTTQLIWNKFGNAVK